jgi:LuxR family maltose regulon positive regulatory protein
MADTDSSSSILYTKLYRPPVTADYTPRNTLEKKLEAGIGLPLTLVCAPAGYGKSTSISQWLESSDQASAWVSLDDSDSDLRNFLRYLVAAIQTIDAESCQTISEDLGMERLPSTRDITIDLSNDIEALKERIVLVFDDFQRIKDPDVLSILDALLEHPLRNLHLVILSRRDPTLSIATLRVRHLINEIRMQDLKFSYQETDTFIKAATTRTITTKIIEELQRNTEGWPAALRLATLALQSHENIDSFLTRFDAGTLPVQEYLIGEVLSSLPTELCEKLIFISILPRFNAPLCEFVWASDLSDSPESNSGKTFIATLKSAEIFCIALDEGQEWYRLQHLFQGLLGRQLHESLGSKKVLELQQRASRWFFKHNYFEEAIHHAKAGEDFNLAIEIIAQARHQLMNTNQWHRLESWLNLFSNMMVQQQPQLLLLQCWLDLFLTYRLDHMAANIDMAEKLLQYSPPDTPKLDEMSAELNCLQAVVAYSVSNAEGSATLSRQCLAESPEDQECVRTSACWIQIMADQMRGEVDQAENLLWDTLSKDELSSAAGIARLWSGAAYNAWCEANTRKLKESADQLYKIGTEHQLSTSLSFAHYFYGLLNYESNNPTEAITHFEAVADNPSSFVPARVVDCSVLLILCYQATGNTGRARNYLDQLSAYVLEHSAVLFLGMMQALQAEIDLSQGYETHAYQWASRYSQPPAHSMHRGYQSEFTMVKILLAQNTAESRSAASKLLDYLHDFLTKMHHRRFLIDVLTLKATLAYHEADESAAVALLAEAFELSKPGRIIRPFMDLPFEMIPLLNRLDMDTESMEYLGTILAALTGSDSEAPAANHSTVEVLSQRELEVLKLLAQNHTDKSIAESLFISMGTVKRHAHNIFGKLGVNARQAAVAKAIGLGILEK